MQDRTVSIGEVKRDISGLVNRVAYGGERILLTSRGKPKAALVSVEDYKRLLDQERGTERQQWQAWMHRADDLSQHILRERGGEPLHIDYLIESAKADLEARHDDLFNQ
jgi:prevent-host-death family protein